MATNNSTDNPDLTTDGQLLIGNTGNRPTAATLTAGHAMKVTNGSGTIEIDLGDDTDETAVHAWNGAVLETPTITVTSNGSAITFSVEKSGGGDLTLVFSDEFATFDTTPAATISLTAGTDTVPVLSYVYIPQSTKVLTVSTSSFPTTEHIPLATVLCQSAASLQTDGAYKVHAWTDHVTDTNNQGHTSHFSAWIRAQNATWQSGVGQTFTITANGGAADNVILTTVAGVVLQLHDHTFPAFSGTPDVYTVNDSVTPYNKVTDLNALLTDSAGVSMSGKFFSLVIWGVVSEATGDCKLFVNLPSGSYNNATSVTADPSRFANFSIPTDFRGTGFLIAQWNLRHQVAASGTWTSIDEIDLRGFVPNIVAGGATASTSEFIDTVFRIIDDGDNTKEIAFQASGITTATTRTLTVQDASGTIAYTNVAGGGTGATTFTNNGVLVGSGTAAITPLAVGTNGQLLVGSTGADPIFATATAGTGLTATLGAGTFQLDADTATSSTIGVATFDENDFLVTAGDVTLANRTRLRPGYVENLGIDYNGGTGVFTVQGAQATLSSTNPGFVCLQSKADSGELTLYEVTADQSFIDDAGSSEIINNLFGLTTSVAWATDTPFYIYAVGNDDEDAIAFMISRVPGMSKSPVTAQIGAPDDAVADAQFSFFSFDNIDETLYDENPCLMIGSMRMQMSASDDWTVQTLDALDGIGRYQENRAFFMVFEQFGAAAGTYMKTNGGTAMTWANNNYTYFVDPFNQMCFIEMILSGNTATDGAGAVTMQTIIPFNPQESKTYALQESYWNGLGNQYEHFPQTSLTGNYFQCTRQSGLALLTHASFPDGDRYFANAFAYKIGSA